MTALLSALLFSASLVAGESQPASTNDVTVAKRSAKITSSTAYYDRKEGVAILTGNVFVDDVEYALHADKAFVFMDGTNELKHIVAVGGVALTNGTKRAYGGKASYYRQNGLVVLYASADSPARVVDAKPDGEQVVTGQKIRFWTGAEQVEVLDSTITAPVGNLGDIKDLNKRL